MSPAETRTRRIAVANWALQNGYADVAAWILAQDKREHETKRAAQHSECTNMSDFMYEELR